MTEKNIERSTVGYIYEEVILKDLLEAARLLDPLPIMRKNFRINQPAIHILLSRVYLYMENYKECIAEVEKAEKQGIELLNMVNNLAILRITVMPRFLTITRRSNGFSDRLRLQVTGNIYREQRLLSGFYGIRRMTNVFWLMHSKLRMRQILYT